ncbi:hypothetical protein CEP52_013539 [Fusarium oligoseptatum]|uniref:Elicitin n=1 Tax=Fusarium oligoseptatum TaxID=2604345 RepID=A0A428ST63_9HYPO|nr:hypothetical protein CEP52_013539 [Fusarium oligoseptatum]
MQHFQILVASLLGTATAQQLPKYKYDYDFRPFEGITPTCKAALNKVIDRDTLLARYGPEGIMPSVKQMTEICTATCHNSLVQFKKDIQKACPVESNIVHWPDGSNFTVASYVDTCETMSVSISIMKGTSTATGTSVSTDSSGAEMTPVVMDTSTEVTPSPSPEIPVLTPMSSGASTFAINLISFIVPVLVLTSQWRWFGRN